MEGIIFNKNRLKSNIRAIVKRNEELRKEIMNLLSKLNIKFRKPISIPMVDAENELENYKTIVDVYGISELGIFLEEDCEGGMEYDHICTDDLISILERIVETDEFKEKYLKKGE